MNFKEEALKLNINLDELMEEKFSLYYDKLIEVNSYMNLTRITDRNEVYNKHFYDSLTILKAIGNLDIKEVLDVGGGAGFPSIPLAIARPDLNITIIDALNKRINFLNDLKDYLGLNNVTALHERAEDYVKEKRDYYEVVTARAVARLNVLCELCLPLVKVNGLFVALKGNASDELDEAKNAIEILGGKLENVITFDLPDDEGKREIIVIRKIKESNKKYPRLFSKIKEKPL